MIIFYIIITIFLKEQLSLQNIIMTIYTQSLWRLVSYRDKTSGNPFSPRLGNDLSVSLESKQEAICVLSAWLGVNLNSFVI